MVANMRVMIVEDFADSAAMLARLVEICGHQAVIAENGFQAVALAQKMPIDLVLMDIQMPGMSGYDTTRRLRQELGMRQPIYALTAFNRDTLREEDAGLDGHYCKPLDFAVLRSLLNG